VFNNDMNKLRTINMQIKRAAFLVLLWLLFPLFVDSVQGDSRELDADAFVKILEVFDRFKEALDHREHSAIVDLYPPSVRSLVEKEFFSGEMSDEIPRVDRLVGVGLLPAEPTDLANRLFDDVMDYEKVERIYYMNFTQIDRRRIDPSSQLVIITTDGEAFLGSVIFSWPSLVLEGKR